MKADLQSDLLDDNPGNDPVIVGIKKLEASETFPSTVSDETRIVNNVVSVQALTVDGTTTKSLAIKKSISTPMTTQELIDGRYITTSPALNGLTVSLSYGGYTSTSNAGDYTITPAISGSAGANFELVAKTGKLTVNPVVMVQPALVTSVYTYTGSPIDVSVNGNITNYVAGGTTLYGYKYTEGGNYSLIMAKRNSNFVWAPGVSTDTSGNVVLPWSITAIDQSLIVADKNVSAPAVKAATYQYGDTINLETRSTTGAGAVTWSLISGPATVSPAGVVTITGVGDVIVLAHKAADSSHNAQWGTITLTAAKKPLQPVINASNTQEYNGTSNVKLTYAPVGVAGVTVDDTNVSATMADANVGDDKPVIISGTFALSGADAQNYQIAQPVTTGITTDVTKKTVTITAFKSIVYGDSYGSDASICYAGFVGSDSKSVITTTSKLGFKAASYAQYGGAGDYDMVMTLDGTDVSEGAALIALTATNYTFVAGDSRLTVAKRPVVLIWDAAKFDHDGAVKTVTASINNSVNSDSVAIPAYTGNTGTDEGLYLAAATALDNPNYTLTGGTFVTHNWGIGKVTVPSDMPSPGPGSGGGVSSDASEFSVVAVTPENKTFEITANKAKEKIGGRDVTTISLADDKAIEGLSTAAFDYQKYTLKVNLGDATDFSVKFTAQSLRELGNNSITINLLNDMTSFVIPAAAIDVDSLMKEVGGSAAPKDVLIRINVLGTSDDTAAALRAAAAKGGFKMMPAPIDFSISAEYNGKTYPIERLGSYVTHLIAVDAGTDSKLITTAAVYDPDGVMRHIPTKITTIGGKQYVIFSSLRNSTYALISNTCSFTDVAGHWAQTEINDMGARLIVTGVGGNRFEPDRSVTRAEFAATLINALGIKLSATTGTFKDVPASAWYSSYVETAYEYGLLKGNGDGTFKPLASITREEAAAMICRAMSITKLDTTLSTSDISNLLANYKDAGDVASYFTSEVAAVISAGLITGRDGKLLAPKSNITRAETATVVYKLLKNSNLI